MHAPVAVPRNPIWVYFLNPLLVLQKFCQTRDVLSEMFQGQFIGIFLNENFSAVENQPGLQGKEKADVIYNETNGKKRKVDCKE